MNIGDCVICEDIEITDESGDSYPIIGKVVDILPPSGGEGPPVYIIQTFVSSTVVRLEEEADELAEDFLLNKESYG